MKHNRFPECQSTVQKVTRSPFAWPNPPEPNPPEAFARSTEQNRSGAAEATRAYVCVDTHAPPVVALYYDYTIESLDNDIRWTPLSACLPRNAAISEQASIFHVNREIWKPNRRNSIQRSARRSED